MKRYIRNTTEEKVLEIVIDFYYDFDDKIEGCFNPDLSESELDQVIYGSIEDDYLDFMDMVADRLISMGFEILEGPDYSNRTGSKSCYFTVCRKSEYDTLTVKIIMNIRISDHRLKKRKGENKDNNRFQAREEYYRKELENYRMLNIYMPEDMNFGLLEIIISNQKFSNFEDAVNFIANKIRKRMVTP